MSKNILFVIDMQNDFIDGSLGNEDAKNIVPNVVKIIDEFHKNHSNDMLFYTLDGHCDNYLDTLEGKKLPIKHCIIGSYGNMLNKEVREAINKYPHYLVKCFYKKTFGSLNMVKEATNYLWDNIDSNDEIFVCGLCTDICVISNILLLRAQFPNIKITCYKDGCAGTSKEAHESALNIMRSCQIDII